MAKNYTTMQDVANLAGVSKTTVSRYLNGHYERMSNETKAKIAKVIKKTGYHVNSQAQALTQHHSHLIGLIVADIENIFSSILFKGADQIVDDAGYSIMLMNANNSLQLERKQLERLINLRVDGIIIQPVSRNASDYSLLQKTGIPVVIADRKLTPPIWPEVITDNYSYSKMLINYVIRQQYKRVIVLTEDVHANSAREERYQGVIDACQNSSVEVELLEITEDISTNKLYEQLSKLKAWDTQTTIYALKGTLLTKLMNTLNEYLVLVPKQVGVVAFDDWDWARLMSPQITTIQQDPKTMGREAGKLIINKINGKTIPQKSTVDSAFMVRHSL
jgi:LacI family kdg operon repressor